MEVAIGSFFFIFILFGIAYFIFWIMAVINAVRNDYLDGIEKIAWIAAMCFFPLLGVLAYWILAKRPPRTPKKYVSESDYV